MHKPEEFQVFATQIKILPWLRKMHVLVHVSKHRKTQTIFFTYSYFTEYKLLLFTGFTTGIKYFRLQDYWEAQFFSPVIVLQIYKPNSDGYYWDVPA